MTRPDADRDLQALLGQAFDEKPIWIGLYESLHDTFFPAKLPPLELTSTPVPIPDRMATKTNPWALGSATLVNGGILAILLCMGLGTINRHTNPPSNSPVDLSELNIFAQLDPQGRGGGGGGSHDLTAPTKGSPPRFEANPILPPQIPLIERPKLAVDPAIAAQVKFPEDPSMPNLGVRDSVIVTLASNGPGSGGGLGVGQNGGDGPGNGVGYGSGEDRGIGGQLYRPGVGGVSAPIPIVTPEAEFSDEARRAKYQGVCLISLIIDARGNPQNPRVVQRLGMGLDEKALEAVLRYRFRPAMKGGKPVPVLITVAVTFRLL